MENVIEYGDVAENFYIILLGVVNIKIPNPVIPDWLNSYNEYKILKSWKKDYLDPLCEKARTHKKLKLK
jgi:hypothetical protein